MPTTVAEYRVFISSPGDLGAERAQIDAIVLDINETLAAKGIRVVERAR